MLEEQEDYNKLDGYEFPWTLVLDQEKIEKYQLRDVLPNVDPPITIPIDLDFQISEPSWVDFTS